MNSTKIFFGRVLVRKADDDQPFEKKYYVITKNCLKDGTFPGFACGCPECLRNEHMTVVYNAKRYEDLHVGSEPKNCTLCPVKVVPVEAARLAPWLILKEYA